MLWVNFINLNGHELVHAVELFFENRQMEQLYINLDEKKYDVI